MNETLGAFLIVMALVIFIFLVVALFLAFWIWMIVDCVKRHFKNESEKIIWILVVVLLQLLGALIYFFVVRIFNPKGISSKTRKKR